MRQAGSSQRNKQRRSSRRFWLLTAIGVVAAIGLLCLSALVPAGVRALPGRYAARLPAFLQQMRHLPHPDNLPTPAVAVTPYLLPTPTATGLRLSGVTYGTSTPLVSRVAGEQETGRTPTHQSTPRSTELPTQQPTSTATVASITPTGTPTAAPVLISTSGPDDTPGNTPTGTPTNTSTSTPTNTSTATPAPPTPTAVQLPVSASLAPVTHTYQTWNNCGPATVSMALSYLDESRTQAEAAAFLKPDPEDKNVSPYEMAAYARSLGVEAIVRVGGDLTRLKWLVASGFPVIVETWFIPEPGDQMGHYRLLTGYDDDVRQFTAQDSYNGPNLRLDYAPFDEMWRVFNRVYLVLHSPSQSDELAAILGADMDDQAMYTRAFEIAQTEAMNPSADCVAYENCADELAFAWFNIGSSLTGLGRHGEAAAAYDQARVLGLPWRMLWYQFGPYESYYSVSRYEDIITLATVTVNITYNLEESFYWRGMAYLAQGNVDRARTDLEAALKYNPGFAAAQEAHDSLE